MALTRRTGQRFQASIWPGFVDAMTALLLVLMFVLSIFMIMQFVLRETISGQADELTELNAELTALAQALGLEQQRGAALETQIGTLTTQAQAQAALITSLNTQLADRAQALDAAQARITSFEAQVASLLAQRDDALATGAALEAERDELLSAQEQLQLALATARDEVDAQSEAARLAAAQREALQAMVADLEANAAQAASSNAALAAQVADLEARLSDEELARLAEAAAAEALRERLQNADTELTAMTLALEEQRRKAEETLTLLAAAEVARTEMSDELDAAKAVLGDADRQDALLAAAREALSGAEAKSAESQRKIALLNQQIATLRAQLGSLQGVLDAAQARDAEAQVQLESLGAQLNSALAQVAAEQRARADLEEAERKRLEAEAKDLENYRSEFFGKLRALLAGREGVRIVGDRFVFSSEVLFEPGSADLAPEGSAQIARVAAILAEVSGDIPPEIDWIIRVDGHTDNIPLIGGALYADNWELSQARALSVVRYMTEILRFPPNRLAATGFGEYQPVNPANTAQARAQNRRIELKLTER